jgi:nucleoside-diphosphate-sugar epimerase
MLHTRGRLLQSDLNEIVDRSQYSLKSIANSRILITGGSGFVGTWITSALMEANQKFSLNLQLTIVTRNQFLATQKLNFEPFDKVHFLEHDVRNTFPNEIGTFDFYIHGSTPSTKETGSSNSELVVESSIIGMNNLLELIGRSSVTPTVMHLSSGAVYGNPNLKVKPVHEREEINRDASTITPYMFAKIETEKIIGSATENGIIHGTNPRLFAFAGPYIALEEHFAVGNFLRDRFTNQKIIIRGNPQTTRSYMYPTDMCNWLLALLVNPTLDTIHIGSNTTITMDQLAKTINASTHGTDISYEGLGSQASYYVPETSQSTDYLNVVQKVNLEDAILRWWKWIHETNR